MKCEIQIASNHSKVLPIKRTDKHFWKNFRPEPLGWLPASQEAQEAQQQSPHRHEPLRAFFAKKSEKFILSRTAVSWRVTREKQSHSYGESRQETVGYEDDFADIAISLDAKVDALIQAEKVELDLDRSYGDNPLLSHARSVLTAQTTSAPLFKECKEHLTSVEIYQRIKSEWDAFTNCPWSADINKTLALLKYHVENGERVRFWSGGFESHYGLRLRTRDHDWIIGDLFIEKSEKAASANTPMRIHQSQANQVASLGRLFLRVDRDRSEHERY